ncbi:hypothetical protein Fcan01_28398 [Folsomia candida]|uniref:Uncharacterized protein n=1 Tax=Folsomia candida TaxID=158441 RepID=A0A226CTQ6_FOLCA|nr:hypothetical protein Fcan01_28398 [Folsomia candida]
MPPVTARDSGKGAFYAPGHSYKSETEHFCDNLKESEKTPKYRNYMKRENLNLVCAAKCHPLQLETPERARCPPSLLKGKPKSCMSCQMPPVTARDSGKGAFYAPRSWLQTYETTCDNFKGIRENCEIKKHENGKPKSSRDSGKGAFYALGHGYKRIRENSEIPKLHEKGKPKSCMSCQMPPVTARDSGKGALYAPPVWTLKVYKQL